MTNDQMLVLNWIKARPNKMDSALRFRSYESPKEEFIKENTSIWDMVSSVLTLAKSYTSEWACNGSFQCSSDCYRSAEDIWRHVIYYFPDVTIFEVMKAIADHRDELSGQYCGDVERRVFKLRSDWHKRYDVALYNEDDHDEYGLVLNDWGALA